jgi:hypothetical protein
VACRATWVEQGLASCPIEDPVFPRHAEQPPTGWLNRPTPPGKRDHKTAAQRPECRRGEIPKGRVPPRREVLEVLKNAGVDPKGADDLDGASGCAVASHGDRRRPGIGHEVLNPTGEPSPHHVLRWQ